jgi:hypothetical protein
MKNVGLILGAVGLLALGGVLGFVVGQSRGQAQAVLTLNDAPLTTTQFHRRMASAVGVATLQQLTKEELQIQFARKNNVLPTEAEVNAKYEEFRKQPDFDKKMAAALKTPEDIKREILVQMAGDAIINQGQSVTDAEVQAFYQRNIDKKNPNAHYYRPDTVVIAAIITDTQQNIQAALNELAKGVSFAEVAAKFSKDVSKQNGGVLPPIQRGRVDPKKLPGLENKLFTMKPGDQFQPMKVGGIWWLIRCVERLPETTVPFEQVKAECRRDALLEKGVKANAQAKMAEFDKFQNEAKINVITPEYKELFGKKN